MSRVSITKAQVRRAVNGFVYVAKIGKHIKIGFSRDVAKRMKAFETSSAQVELLLAFPGDVGLEKRIHELLSEIKIRGEIFHSDWRISQFLHLVEGGGLDSGLQFLEETTPKRRQAKKEEDRGARVAAARQSRAEKDAYFALLVVDRKQRIGW